MTAGEVVAALARGRWVARDEAALQVAIEVVLRETFGDAVRSEVTLTEPSEIVQGARHKIGRIDFMVDDVGLELKVRGSRASVLRQAQRYLLSPALSSLVVASTHAALLSGWPRELAGKPVAPVILRSWL